MLLILRLNEESDAVHGPDVSSVQCMDCPSLTSTSRIEKHFVYKWRVTREQAVTASRAASQSPLFLTNLMSLLSHLPYSRSHVREFEMRDTIALRLVVESCPLLLDRMWSRRIMR